MIPCSSKTVFPCAVRYASAKNLLVSLERTKSRSCLKLYSLAGDFTFQEVHKKDFSSVFTCLSVSESSIYLGSSEGKLTILDYSLLETAEVSTKMENIDGIIQNSGIFIIGRNENSQTQVALMSENVAINCNRTFPEGYTKLSCQGRRFAIIKDKNVSIFDIEDLGLDRFLSFDSTPVAAEFTEAYLVVLLKLNEPSNGRKYSIDVIDMNSLAPIARFYCPKGEYSHLSVLIPYS
jgi:hypothetical protein